MMMMMMIKLKRQSTQATGVGRNICLQNSNKSAWATTNVNSELSHSEAWTIFHNISMAFYGPGYDDILPNGTLTWAAR